MGETARAIIWCANAHRGSPPRLWGIRVVARLAGLTVRFTPTPVGNTSCATFSRRRCSVHPHACGEYVQHHGANVAPVGSPPRLWGIHRIGGLEVRRLRFTPTPVGNTSACASAVSRLPVHPHACGEYCCAISSSVPPCGSPPRLWGIRCASIQRADKTRFTPTPVGNTPSLRAAVRRPSVHPHACGEYKISGMYPALPGGSPPRLWGIQAGHGWLFVTDRFTPTPVGNTAPPGPAHRQRSVHPHACGEYHPAPPARHGPAGSPPRLWGIRVPLCCRRSRLRFTPTPVGNTAHTSCAGPPRTVHPHACGEYARKHGQPPEHIGSPPRLWGIRRRPRRRGCRGRFTPTPVGNTSAASAARMQRTVHPHACGEYVQPEREGHVDGGSPPRLWGIQPARRPKRLPGRFTPTPVGNTSTVSSVSSDRAVHPHACGEYMRGAWVGLRCRGSPPRLWGIHA